MICEKKSLAVYFLSERWSWEKSREPASDESDSRGQNTGSHVIHTRGRGILGTLNSENITFTEWKQSDNYWRVVILWYYSFSPFVYSYFNLQNARSWVTKEFFTSSWWKVRNIFVCFVLILRFVQIVNIYWECLNCITDNLFIKFLMTRNKSVKVLSDSFRNIGIKLFSECVTCWSVSFF